MQCHLSHLLSKTSMPSRRRPAPCRPAPCLCSAPSIGRILWRGWILILLLACMPLAGRAAARRFGGSGSLSALSCSTSSMTGAGSDACTVSLSGSAGYRGVAVTLSSNNSAVAVPASVTVQRGSTAASFAATVTSVSAPQTVTLSATAGGVSTTFVVQVGASAPAITLQSSSVAFGNVSVGSTATQSLVLTSSGTAPLTINAASVAGTSFAGPGTALPITLNPNQTTILQLQFDPTASGADTGSITISSNASNMPTATVSLSGTGQSSGSYQVNLNWQAPASSSDPVTGYNIYRAASGGSYQLLNPSVNTPTTYTDSSVQAGTTYTYEVMSVDAQGSESAPSNVYTAAIP